METIDTGIQDTNRESVAYLLNMLLADEHVLYLKTHNYHWNVKGMHFQSLHRFFETQYQELEEIIDQVAERIRAIGHYATAAMKDYVKITRLLETNHEDGSAETMLQNLLQDHETIIRVLRKNLVEEADKYRDMGTSDFVTGLMEQHEKMAWMIRSYLG
ncbi:Dps family protein [Tunicatimonas pelagia]|uniref:Dps family protein n=1 Tax=Tunicatimonas pelagia TaxID=931531 RepID=UPI0026652AF9|nr:DNA starvation/stationary phase protection protein [Tunicatimonas pelagia]WKN42763.1 DNA starvation/stationary phase protection protein [Tunicatimonas pelagia]